MLFQKQSSFKKVVLKWHRLLFITSNLYIPQAISRFHVLTNLEFLRPMLL